MSGHRVTLVPSAHSNSIFFKISPASFHLKSFPAALSTSCSLISSPAQNMTGKWPCFSFPRTDERVRFWADFLSKLSLDLSCAVCFLKVSYRLSLDHSRYNDLSFPGASIVMPCAPIPTPTITMITPSRQHPVNSASIQVLKSYERSTEHSSLTKYGYNDKTKKHRQYFMTQILIYIQPHFVQ